MPLYRCSAQKRQTLVEFYSELLNHPMTKKDGEAMLALIKKIDETFPNTKIWGLTSHYHLILLAQDDYTSEGYVSIIAFRNEILLEYKIPPELAPWPNAYVKGAINSLDKAMNYLKIAMIESRGWKKEEVI